MEELLQLQQKLESFADVVIHDLTTYGEIYIRDGEIEWRNYDKKSNISTS